MSKRTSLDKLFKPSPPGEPTWTTKDGRMMPIREMEDSHLIRSIRLWRSKVSTLALSSFDPGEFVLQPWIDEKSYEAHKNSRLKRMNADLENLTAEAKKRRIGEWVAFGVTGAENVEGD